MWGHMALKTKIVRDGNSWAVRLPKAVLELSGIEPGSEVELLVKNRRIIIKAKPRNKRQRQADKDRFEEARQDMKQAWDEAFEDIWFQAVGIDE